MYHQTHQQEAQAAHSLQISLTVIITNITRQLHANTNTMSVCKIHFWQEQQT